MLIAFVVNGPVHLEPRIFVSVVPETAHFYLPDPGKPQRVAQKAQLRPQHEEGFVQKNRDDGAEACTCVCRRRADWKEPAIIVQERCTPQKLVSDKAWARSSRPHEGSLNWADGEHCSRAPPISCLCRGPSPDSAGNPV